jgi:hypothetical protein
MVAYPDKLLNVRLRRTTTPEQESQRTDKQVHFCHIVAESVNEGDDPHIFVHRVEVLDPNADPELQTVAFFDHVVTPSEYNELPVGLPGEDDNYLVFRTNEIRHFARSFAEMEALWVAVKSDVARTINAFRRAEQHQSEETLEI